MKKALVIVDAQNDFMPGGSLAVTDGDKIVPVINSIAPGFKLVVRTFDWHPGNHCSFKENGGIWPNHCVRSTPGARLHADLIVLDDDVEVNIFKGIEQSVDSYSAFFDNERVSKTALDDILKEQGVETLYVTGLATDYCVKFTVLDAISLGYNVFVVTDACRGVNVNEFDVENALMDMKDAGAELVHSDEVVGEEPKKFVDTYGVG